MRAPPCGSNRRPGAPWPRTEQSLLLTGVVAATISDTFFEWSPSDEFCAILDAAWAGTPPEETISEPYQYNLGMPCNRAHGNTNTNENSNFRLTQTPPTLPSIPANKYLIRTEDQAFVEAIIAKVERANIAKDDAHAVSEAFGKRFQAKRPSQGTSSYA